MTDPLRNKVGMVSGADSMVAARDATSPTGKMGIAWNIIKPALFLALDDAASITGVIPPVDGGLSCRAA